MKKFDLGIVVTTLIIVTITCSLAFFAAKIAGESKNINLVAKNVSITFNDTSTIADTVITPGWSATKTFTITNDSTEEFKYNISIKNLINTFVTSGYLQYKITSSNGYSMSEYKDIPKSSTVTDKILAYSVSIPVGTTQEYTITFQYLNDENVDQSDDMGKTLSGMLFITEGTEKTFDGTWEAGTLGAKILADNPTKTTRSDFSTVFTSDTTETLYTATEANVHNTTETTVYYYAGNTTNNWVKFAKDSSGNDLYWRIIRTNADGSVRLLYHGTSTDSTEAYIGTSAFNSTFTDPMYVGYMYGTSGSSANNRTNTTNSTIKTAIDTWYANNMTAYTSYLSTTAVYCNDRSLASGSTYSTTSTFYYAANERLKTNKTPSYNCTTAEDAFSVDNTSAKLTYPIGLMTADEISYAGGVYNASLSSPYAWYYSNSAEGSSVGSNWWWLLSASFWYYDSSSDRDAGVFFVYGSNYPGRLNNGNVFLSIGVRPTVSVKSETVISGGTGTPDNPYIID